MTPDFWQRLGDVACEACARPLSPGDIVGIGIREVEEAAVEPRPVGPFILMYCAKCGRGHLLDVPMSAGEFELGMQRFLHTMRQHESP